MAHRRIALWPAVTLGVGLLAFLISLPSEWKGWAPEFLSRPGLHLGLDLAGGTQLDFRISEEEMRQQAEQIDAEIDRLKSTGAPADDLNLALAQKQSLQDQQANLVEAIRGVLERRINSLGVSEATITPSYVGNEKHLLVECPGVVDVQECIKVVGKTIQLEFKEQLTEASPDYTQKVRANAQAALRRITESGSNLLREGEDLGNDLGMAFQDNRLLFRDELPNGLEGLWTQRPGQVVLREGSVTQAVQNDDGSIGEREVPGVFLAEVLQPPTGTGRVIADAREAFGFLTTTEPNTSTRHHERVRLDASGTDQRVAAALRSMETGTLQPVQTDLLYRVLFLSSFERGGEQIGVSHILVSYAGASGAGADITRTKEEALARAEALKRELDTGLNFADYARTRSDGESRENGGSLGLVTRGTMPPAFEQAAFGLAKVGEYTEPIETQFGYHIIRLDRTLETASDIATYDELVVSGPDAKEHLQEIIDRLQNGQVKTTEPAITVRLLFFSLEPTGWKDTALDGKHFRTATVTVDSVTNIPVVQIVFDAEGGRLFQELTKRNIGKPIAIFVGGELVSAPRVQQEISGGVAVITGSGDFSEARTLAQDLNTGAIPAPIYLVGQYTVEPTLGAAALQTSLMAALIGTFILMVFMVIMYRAMGVTAALALVFYAILLFAIMKMPLFLFSNNYIVLTLAGMAGIILSIGMAVDANVLVFERMKEELRKGKAVKTAIESSFKHSWPAIRDGNITALITCVILFMAGSSIVRGFAVTLGMGVLLSVFTAVTVTRWLLRQLVKTKLAQNPAAFGVKSIAHS